MSKFRSIESEINHLDRAWLTKEIKSKQKLQKLEVSSKASISTTVTKTSVISSSKKDRSKSKSKTHKEREKVQLKVKRGSVKWKEQYPVYDDKEVFSNVSFLKGLKDLKKRMCDNDEESNEEEINRAATKGQKRLKEAIVQRELMDAFEKSEKERDEEQGNFKKGAKRIKE